jgi:hypothetical protein
LCLPFCFWLLIPNPPCGGAQTYFSVRLANLVAFLRRTTDAKPTASQRGLLVIGIAMILAHFLTATGLIPWYVLIFLVGLLQQVFIAALNFVLLLFPVNNSR